MESQVGVDCSSQTCHGHNTAILVIGHKVPRTLRTEEKALGERIDSDKPNRYTNLH